MWQRIAAFVRELKKPLIIALIVYTLGHIFKWLVARQSMSNIASGIWDGLKGVPHFFLDIQQATPSVRFVLNAMLLLLIICIAVLIHSLLKIMRGCALYDTKNRICRLGIAELRDRKETHLTDVFGSIESSYEWTGLSANNELSPTLHFDALSKAGERGAEINYLLMNPDDVIRLKDHAHWEANVRKPDDLRANIVNSLKCARRLGDKDGIKCLARTTDRLPCLRVTKINDSDFHVAHYDKGGCGFYGKLLVIRKTGKNEGIEGANLYDWFSHYVALEQKNVVIDDFYAAIVKEYCDGATETDIVNSVLVGQSFADLRKDFEKNFEWRLDEDIVKRSLEFVEKRYGLEKITRYTCNRFITEKKCEIGVAEIVEEGADTFDEVVRAEASIKYFGTTGFWPLQSLSTRRGREQLSEKIRSVDFFVNEPGGASLIAAERLYGRKHDPNIPKDWISEYENFFRSLPKGVPRERKPLLIWHDVVPAFRLLNIDEEKLYVSFYKAGGYIKETPVLVIKNKRLSNCGVNLYDWFNEFLNRFICSLSLWDIEREVMRRWIKEGEIAFPDREIKNILDYGESMFRDRNLGITDICAREIVNRVIENVKKRK